MGFFQSQPNTLKKDLRVARRSAMRTAFIVILLVSGVVPAVTFLFGGSGNAELSFADRLSPLWGVCLHTYPLTLSVAVITFSRKQKWFRFGKWFFAASVMMAGASLSNGLSQWTGHSLIERANVIGEYNNPIFGILGGGINYFFGFYETYGFAPFVASILVGSFAGSIASRFSRHVPRDLKQATGVVSEIVASRRTAA